MKKATQLETLLVIVLALIIFYLTTKNKYLLIVAISIGVFGLLFPSIAKAVNWIWEKLSHILGFISGKILLTLVFIIVLIPLSFVARLFNKTNLRLKPGGTTYFKIRNHIFTKEDLENLW